MHGGLHCLVVGADAYQPDGLDVDRNTVVGQRVLQVDDARHLEPRTAAHHLGLPAPGEHRDLIRRHLDVVAHVDER
ncbi:Uncharacterised protein [Mycobacteroides abscessus subsp. massiliense]|nr:Uncharacterised protein [Mycobacteroides abscessus subsp. massiliense]